LDNGKKFLRTQLPSVKQIYINTFDEISVLLEKNRSNHKEIKAGNGEGSSIPGVTKKLKSNAKRFFC